MTHTILESTIIAVGGFLATATGIVAYARWRQRVDSDKGPKGNIRSPCPMLNMLANEGKINRDGRNITVPAVSKAMMETLNIDSVLAYGLAVGGLAISPHPFSGRFNLNDMARHNFIEHDASLTRADLASGDNITLDQDVLDSVMKFYDGMDETTIEAAAKARYARVQDSRKNNPHFTYGKLQSILSHAETAMYLSAMGNPETGVAKVDYVKTFLGEERLPTEQGWKKPTTKISMASVNKLTAKMAAAAQEQPSDFEPVKPAGYGTIKKDILDEVRDVKPTPKASK